MGEPASSRRVPCQEMDAAGCCARVTIEQRNRTRNANPMTAIPRDESDLKRRARQPPGGTLTVRHRYSSASIQKDEAVRGNDMTEPLPQRSGCMQQSYPIESAGCGDEIGTCREGITSLRY